METVKLLSIKKRNPIARVFDVEEWKAEVEYNGQKHKLKLWASVGKTNVDSLRYSIGEKLGIENYTEMVVINEEKAYLALEHKIVQEVTEKDVIRKRNEAALAKKHGLQLQQTIQSVASYAPRRGK